jgi:DNA-binding NtrC family response regulator
MTAADLILIRVEEPHRSALLRWAGAAGLASLELADPEALGTAGDLEPILCVLGARGEADVPLDRIRLLRKALAGCPLVVLVRDIGIGCAVDLARSGVEDVVESTRLLTHDISRVTRHARREAGGAEIVGNSFAARQLRHEIAAAAPLGSPILLCGEVGVGKETVARAIHRRGRLHRDPFVVVDCDALDAPAGADLFGTERGTVLLDEVADLKPAVQARLVRRFSGLDEPGTIALASAPRVMAATTRDLREEVRSGHFRGDLYVRLNVVWIRVPPLRERLADLAELVTSAIERAARRISVRPPPLTEAVFEAMAEYAWPGNLRELENLVEQALLRYHGGLLDEAGFLAALDPQGAHAGGPERGSSDLSRAAIASVLAATGGNVARAARRLGVPRTTLAYRIRVLGLEDRVPRD